MGTDDGQLTYLPHRRRCDDMSSSERFVDLPLRELLDRVAAQTATPGSGSVAAVVVGLAVSGEPASRLHVGASDAAGPPASAAPAPSGVNGQAVPASVATPSR